MGGMGRVVGEGLRLHVSEVAGQVVARLAVKAAPNLLPERMRGQAFTWYRLVLGIFGGRLLRMLRVPSAWADTFGAVQVAQSIYSLTTAWRNRTLASVGLGDFVTVDGLGDEDDVELLDEGGMADDYGLLAYDEEPDEYSALNDYVTIPEYA